MEVLEVTQQQEIELKQQALTVIERSKLVKITSQETYNDAAKLLLEEIKPFRKRWAEFWDEIKKPLRQTLNAVQDKFNAADKPLEAAEAHIKNEIRRYDAEQERIRQEAQREAQLEAERKAEEERLAAAVMAEQAGASEEQIEEIASAPVMVVAPPVEPTYQRAAGISKARDNWKAKVTDMKKLCLAVAKGVVPAEYVLPNESALNARAKADKGTLNIPGVVPYNDPIIAGRAK